MLGMGRPSVALDRARRRIEADLRRAIEDVAAGRRNAGLSLRTIGAACGVSRSAIDRMEAHRADSVDVVLLASMAASVGLDLRLRAYPAGDPIRDAGQQRLLERLRVRLHPSLRFPTEVVLPIAGDLRAWDAVIRGANWRIGVEAETVLDDIQAVERKLALKQRDGGIDHVILLVADTPRNRRALAAAPGAFATFSRDSRAMLRALRDGRDPGYSGIVIL
jgi:transcriptional regulator with XRE-family HTH domain